jgi:hypothetical protein
MMQTSAVSLSYAVNDIRSSYIKLIHLAFPSLCINIFIAIGLRKKESALFIDFYGKSINQRKSKASV